MVELTYSVMCKNRYFVGYLGHMRHSSKTNLECIRAHVYLFF